MFMLVVFIFLTMMFIALLKIISMLLSEKVMLTREELTYYECGFESKSISRIPFSFRYFLLTLVFLLFDLELLFLVLIPMNIFYQMSYFSILIILIFILILILGLVYEWLDGSLEWIL